VAGVPGCGPGTQAVGGGGAAGASDAVIWTVGGGGAAGASNAVI
jgi:hypothetical protein